VAAALRNQPCTGMLYTFLQARHSRLASPCVAAPRLQAHQRGSLSRWRRGGAWCAWTPSTARRRPCPARSPTGTSTWARHTSCAAWCCARWPCRAPVRATCASSWRASFHPPSDAAWCIRQALQSRSAALCVYQWAQAPAPMDTVLPGHSLPGSVPQVPIVGDGVRLPTRASFAQAQRLRCARRARPRSCRCTQAATRYAQQCC